MSTAIMGLTTSWDASPSGVQSKSSKSSATSFDVDEKDIEEATYDEVLAVESVADEALDDIDAKEEELEAPKEKEEEEETVESVEEEVVLDDELESALDTVRELAAKHQEQFVEEICGIFRWINGSEPSINDLSAIFGRIKEKFAEEAMEDDDDYNLDYDDEDDSDYDENDIDDNEQVLDDEDEDYFYSEDGEDEYSEPEDSDYDPNDARDVEQVQRDRNEDYSEDESDVVGKTENEDEENANWVFGADEECILNSESFDAEYFAAIQCAQNQAMIDQEKICNAISEQYLEETGEEATKEMFLEAFREFAESENEGSDGSENEEEAEMEEMEESEEEEESAENEESEELQVESLSNEMDLALDHVRKLAAFQREEFVNEICDVLGDSNGYEPTLGELSEILDGIKANFAEEAREEFLEESDDEESGEEQDEEEEHQTDPEDSDYDPNDALDIKQVQDDLDEDYSESDQSESDHVQDID